jgi:hypothetical protein
VRSWESGLQVEEALDHRRKLVEVQTAILGIGFERRDVGAAVAQDLIETANGSPYLGRQRVTGFDQMGFEPVRPVLR